MSTNLKFKDLPQGTSFTPGVRNVAAKLGSYDSFQNSSDNMKEFCGLSISGKEIERIAEAAGEKIEVENKAKIESAFSENVETERSSEDIPVMYLEYDGTGIPMTKKETDGRKGKQEDGTSKTREAKLGCIFTQSGTDTEGNPIRDANSTAYFGAIETAEGFGNRLYAEAVHNGLHRAKKTVVIGDGAKWIWNLANLHFPDSIKIVDLYHAKEHVFELIKLKTANIFEQNAFKKSWFSLLEAGNISELTNEISKIKVDDEDKQKKIDREIGYFTENAARMQYAEFKKQHLFVGSGVIEAGCKNVIGKRLKQSGMRWSVRGANDMIALRCAVLSGSFKAA